MDVLVPHVRLTFGSSFAYVLAQLGLALVLFGLAIWFMRRELVPIEHLGVAADALGKGRDVPDFAFSGGTREVRNAATAFPHDAHPSAPLDPAAHRDAGRRQPRLAYARSPA
jgi:two-component system osmolarity sensor histidine kinase EnvZ